MSKIILTSGAAPSTPTSGTVALYSDANDTLRFKKDNGDDIGLVTIDPSGVTTLDQLQFEDHGSNAQMWLIEEDSNNPTNALVFDYSGTERLRIVPSGDIADSNNNVVLSFSSTNEDGVNWIDVKNNSTGSGPIISSVGSDTNIDLNISAKGTGIVNLGSGGVKLNAPLDVNSQALTNVDTFSFSNGVVLSFASGGEVGANWVDVVWAETGSGPVIRSVGGDPNIDLNLTPKGTGKVVLDILAFRDNGGNAQRWTIEEDSDSPTNALTFDYAGIERLRIVPAGSFAIDGNNVVLSFASGGESAVNNVEIVHATTGSGPIVRSVGADTNIDLNISAKGTGIVNLGSGGVRLNANLDANGNTIITDGNTVLSFASSGENAVNWVDIVHATTGSGPVIRSVGSDSNVDLVFDTKGTGDIDVSSNKIVNVVNPTSAQDAATKAYVDSGVGGDLGEFTVAGLPTASSNANAYALATNAVGGRTIVRSDGTNWKVVVVEGATVTV